MQIANGTLGVLLDIERRTQKPVEEPMKQLDLEAELLKEYHDAGIEADKETIERAIILHAAKPFQHRATKSIMGLAYIRRKLIGKVAAGIVAAGMTVQAGNVIIENRHQAHLRAEETRVEQILSQTWDSIYAEGKRIERVESDVESSTLPKSERDTALQSIRRATQAHQDTFRVLREITPRESIADRVTTRNYAEIETRARDALGAMAGDQKVNGELARVSGILDNHKQLSELGAYFAGVSKQINNLPLNSTQKEYLLARVTDGKEAITRRDAQGASKTKSGIIGEMESAQLYAKAESQAHKSIDAIAAIPPAEQAAMDIFAQLSARYQQAQRNANGREMQAVTHDLSDLEATLNSSYDLIINDRERERTGVERDGTKHYIVVRPMRNGQNVTVKVMDEELGQMVETPVYAVRVAFNGQVYNSVKNDKLDNQTVDNNHFGAKRRGYLNPTFDMQNEGKYITRW